jgi:hypothetical protein
LTIKKAIKEKCKDCCPDTNGVCDFKKCPIKDKESENAIYRYCKQCLNGNPFSVCNSPECSIYKWRMEHPSNFRERIDV